MGRGAVGSRFVGHGQTFRVDLTDEVGVHTYRLASLGQVRTFIAEIAQPSSGPQPCRINVKVKEGRVRFLRVPLDRTVRQV
jgi:hypothetical protein